MNVEIEVSFEDRNGKKYKNNQNVSFKIDIVNGNNDIKINNDMIENDDFEEDKVYEIESYYDNDGIRKGILLCKYVELIKNWLSASDKKEYQLVFKKFLKFFEKEMKKCNDNSLQKEIRTMQIILNQYFT